MVSATAPAIAEAMIFDIRFPRGRGLECSVVLEGPERSVAMYRPGVDAQPHATHAALGKRYDAFPSKTKNFLRKTQKAGRLAFGAEPSEPVMTG